MFRSNDLKVDKDEDGVIITDGEGDRCYIYFKEIPSVIRLLFSEYEGWIWKEWSGSE